MIKIRQMHVLWIAALSVVGFVFVDAAGLINTASAHSGQLPTPDTAPVAGGSDHAAAVQARIERQVAEILEAHARAAQVAPGTQTGSAPKQLDSEAQFAERRNNQFRLMMEQRLLDRSGSGCDHSVSADELRRMNQKGLMIY